ncbi:MAG: hypothetical protein KUL82_11645 [Bdellovibrio sp.]|uniref:hypothetical protein n=1 Tax=Bdellovibrio sp. TaxID=28201 RepID=UPI0039E5D0AF|nr:hypothetical protein [Bdellovibrio sp.]
MSLTDLISWCIGIILGWSAVSNIDLIQQSILRAQTKLIYESRTATWGSPKFLVHHQGNNEIERAGTK